MKIVVAVKQVAALDDEFELLDDGSGVDPDFVERELNEWDAFSLEAALQLRESTGDDGEVVVVTVGDDEADEALLGCLARGADRAVRVWDDSLQGADPLAVARVLAAAVGRESRRSRAVRRAVLRRGQRGDRRRARRLPRDCPTSLSSSRLDYDAASRRRPSSASSRAGWSRCCGSARRRC